MDKDLEITYKQLKDFVEKIHRFDDKDIIPFSFLTTALYPKAYLNFEKQLGDTYHKGFMDGYLEGKKLQNES